MHYSHHKLLAIVFGLIATLGCFGGPTAIQVPKIDAESAAVEAASEYDKDGDNVLSQDELESCPSLLAAAS